MLTDERSMRRYAERLKPLKYHPLQRELFDDTKTIRYRFNVVHPGRRSGKSEICGKRRLVARAVYGVKAPNPRYAICAPTRDQVKKIYWRDLKTMTLPYQDPDKEPRESDLIIFLRGDREIHLIGMDKPERIEGSHWDGICLDEYANMKKETWEEHVRPALSTPGRPPAWCDFVGVPEGRNHYYHLAKFAKAQRIEFGENSEWNVWHWPSSDILTPDEIASAKVQMDELTFQQEYCHLPETEIKLWNGFVKQIKDVVVGDIVPSFQNGKMIPAKVVRSIPTGEKDVLEVMLEDCSVFRASADHKMRVDGEKRSLKDCEYIDVIYQDPRTSDREVLIAGLIGFTYGDGTVSRRKNGDLVCGWYADDRGLLENIVGVLNYIGLETVAKGSKKDNGFQLSLGNKISEFLVERGCPVGNRSNLDYGVPEWIKNGPWKVQRAFIAGLFDADGFAPRPDEKSGKGVKLGIGLIAQRVIEDCSRMLIAQGAKATVTRRENVFYLYVNSSYLERVGFLFHDQKAEKAWLWKHYLKSKRMLKIQIAELRKNGLTWKAVGEKLNISKDRAYALGKLFKNSQGGCHDFPTFDEWVKHHYKNRVLKLKIISKKQLGPFDCHNITVDSPDHSYILANGFDNFNCGEFINFSGRVYYNFFDDTHCAKLQYNPKNNLVFCFDFNVDPGVAAVIQEQNLVDVKTMLPLVGTECTGVIGEVFIPRNSNTEKVCRKLVQDWGEHEGKVFVYGDSTGGHRGSAKIKGSDWDLVKQILDPVFGDRLIFMVPLKNPPERARVNAMNSRLKNTLGEIRLQVDPVKAPHVVLDFEGVALVEGGSGEIDKRSNLELTHISDSIGYHVQKEYPVIRKTDMVRKLTGF